MLIRCGYDIRFDTETKTAMMAMLSLHPSRHQDLRSPQRLLAEPDIPLYHFEDGFGNIATRLTVPPGGVTLSCDFIIEDNGEPDMRPGNAPQMNSDLADEIAADAGLTKADARKIVDAVFIAVADAAAKGEEISLNGFGKLKVKDTPEHEGRNPATGEAMTIKAARKLSFTPAKAVKDRLNG